MFKKQIIFILCIFVFGWLANSVFSFLPVGKQIPFSFSFLTNEAASPGDWIKESQIQVYSNKVVINVKNPRWATFTDTNSMDPFIDIGANSIEIKPESADELNVGDVISYKSDYADGIVIHRIVEKGVDEEGIYFIAKGDNNKYADPGKIRFEQIQGVVVGVIY